MIYIVEIERKNGHTNVCHCTIRRIDTVKGEFLMPRSFEGDENWRFKDYAKKVRHYLEMDKPKQIIFETFGISRGLCDEFMNLKLDGCSIDMHGNILYAESKTA